MAIRQEVASKLVELRANGVPLPPPIQELKARIKIATHVLDEECENGSIPWELVGDIVDLKLQLDALYLAWAERECKQCR